MKKIFLLLILFSMFLIFTSNTVEANEIQITRDYNFMFIRGREYSTSNGNISTTTEYDITNRQVIRNNIIIASPLKFHYVFFWTETGTFIGYYKTEKGFFNTGNFLGTVTNANIPIPWNAHTFAFQCFNSDEYIAGATWNVGQYQLIDYSVFSSQTVSYYEFYLEDSLSERVGEVGFQIIIVLISFALMFFGMITKKRILNLFAVGALVVMGMAFSFSIGLVVIIVGLIIFNLLFTFYL